ncbi:glycosyltransferase [Liquorilactobacillus nagelii]|uniref:glycosyltransferase n=1 Tax=Liquorilactobacillus nagelii TaxID=82688 RepID=UPI0006F04F29|nr:glycosyltransferase [Liquorilactobacillus nagelii]KRL41494.1 dtdp-rhamnosyl transferase [Liquorilactobacillus nagelii DSM 13675]QYH54173.1 glycosyltransferase [Liquorilactobacillus nagelii DSM 13675]
MTDKIGALLVTFNPNIPKLKESLNRIINQVSKVIIVDNGSNNISSIKKLSVQLEIKLLDLEKNYGIAGAQNRGFEFFFKNNFKWVLTLDQDTMVPFDTVKKMRASKKFKDSSTAILAMKYYDPSWKPAQIKRATEKQKETETQKWRIISSGNLVRTDIWNLVDGFDEWLFIDQVDFDFNAKVILAGYKIWQVNNLIMEHEIGKSIKKPVLTMMLLFKPNEFILDHSPMREYYIARNTIVYSKRYSSHPDLEKFKTNLFHEIIMTRKILLYQKPRIKKIQASWRGIVDGIKYDPEKDQKFIKFKQKIKKRKI